MILQDESEVGQRPSKLWSEQVVERGELVAVRELQVRHRVVAQGIHGIGPQWRVHGIKEDVLDGTSQGEKVQH